MKSSYSGFPEGLPIMLEPSGPNFAPHPKTIKDEKEYQCTQTVRHVGNCVLTHDFATDSWGSEECVEAAQMVEDGYAKGTVTCTQQVKDGDMVDGIKIVASQFTGKPKVFKSITNLCKLASVSADSSFSSDSAEMDCYEHTVGVDDNGELVKETVYPGQNTGTNVDSCQRYVEQGCTFVKSECLDEMSGDSGNCYATELTYRCNNDPQTFLKESTETVTTCDGLTCYGNDCITSETSDNTDFEKAVALLDAATYMANDIECDANSIDNCKFLSGSGLECKIAVGGWQNCCDPNASFGLRKFMKIVGSVLKVWGAVNTVYNMYQAGDTYIVDGKKVTQADYNKWVEANGNTGELKWDENGNLIGGTGKYTLMGLCWAIARTHGFKPAHDFGDMLLRRLNGIINCGRYGYGSGPWEDSNNAIKVLKRTANGFLDFDYLSLKILARLP